MYGFFYPENGERFGGSLSFPTAQEAIDWFRDKRSTWQDFAPTRKGDEAAFLNPITGDVVVVRKLP